MRNTSLILTVPIVAICMMALGACKTTPKSDTEDTAPAPRQTTETPATATLAGRLEAVKPQLERTMRSLDAVVANANTPALGASSSAFSSEFRSLRRDADRVIAELDQKRRESDAWFLDRERTVAITSQPGVLESREELGFVGEYLVQLRRDYLQLLDALNAVEAGLGSEPTAASVDSIRPQVATAHRNRRNVDNDITVLLAEMNRVNFGR